MMKFVQLWLTLYLFSIEVLHVSVGIDVKFPNKEPLYIAPGRTLVLEAQVQLQQNEQIKLRSWERRNADGEVRVAGDGHKLNNNRTFLEKNGTLLRIKEVQNSDYGNYTVTVTAANGDQVFDSREVRTILNPPAASLAMHCSVPSEGAQWDSPSFSWQVDGVGVTNGDARLSDNGSMLHLIKLSRNYTCISDSSQGMSKVELLMTDLTEEPTKEPCSCPTICYAALIVLILCIIALCGLIWKNRCATDTGQQRNQEEDFPLN